MTKNERQRYEKAGRRAETLACWLLRLKGYLILERRYKTRHGEIDIIAKKRNVIVMAEVKQRSTSKNLHESVSFENTRRIMDAAEIFLNGTRKFHRADYELRFGIIHIIGRWKIRHIKDAFQGY